MTDYASLKVPDLKALLSERNLPQTGNKAALIARLEENDASAAAEPAPAAPAEPASAPAAPAPASAPAVPAESTPKEAAQPTAEAPAAETKTAPSFSIGLQSTAAEQEARKRADRAKRFGLDEDEEAKRRADRAGRFGLDEKELASGLDSALPERPLKRGRGKAADGENRPGKKQTAAPGGGAGILDDPEEKAKAEKRRARFAAA